VERVRCSPLFFAIVIVGFKLLACSKMPPKKVLGPGTKFEDLLAANKAESQRKTKGTAKAAATTVSTDASTQAAAKPSKKAKGAAKGAAKKAPAKVIKASISSVAEQQETALVAVHAPPVVVKPELQELKAATNFTDEEDLFLCRAFVNVSTDSTVGCNQKVDVFWSKVHAKMYELYHDQAEVVIPGTRPAESLKNRFQKTISTSAVKFVTYYRQVVGIECGGKPPSGFDQDGLMNAAVDAYNRMERKPFRFRNCLVHLWEIPKFNPLVKPQKKKNGDDEGSVATGTATAHSSVMGSNLDRPPGVRKTKKQKLLEKLDGSTTPAMRSMDVNNAVMQSMDATSRFKAHQVALSMRAQIAIKLGRTAEAERCLDLMTQHQEADFGRAKVDIPQAHKALPSLLVSEKQTGPSPLTVEGLGESKDSATSGEDSNGALGNLFRDETTSEEGSSAQELAAPVAKKPSRVYPELFPPKPTVQDLTSSDESSEERKLSARAKLKMAQQLKSLEHAGSSSEGSDSPTPV
jgi:hypothetical protein